jgi:hypothetical protein
MAWELPIGLCALASCAAMLAPGAVLAQTTTSTNCYMIGSQEHCDSQTTAPSAITPPDYSGILRVRPPDYVGSYVNAFALGQVLAAQREAAAAQSAEAESREAANRRELDASAAAWREEEDRKARWADAGQTILNGHCDEARANALKAGDLDLAAKVDAICPKR